MVIELLGHIFQLGGLLAATFTLAMGFLLMESLKGGRISKASRFEAIGLALVGINTFIIYASAITGNLDLLHPSILWPITGLFSLIGFTLLGYGRWQTLKVVAKSELLKTLKRRKLV